MMNIEVGVRTLYWQSYAPPLGIAGLKMGFIFGASLHGSTF